MVQAAEPVGLLRREITAFGGVYSNAICASRRVTLIVSNTVQDLQITTDTDDVYYDPGGLSGGIWNVSGSLNYNHTSFVGSWNGVVNAFSTGVRYSGVNVPQGAQITGATLSIYGGTMPPINGPSLIRVYSEAADNAPEWADVAGSRPGSIPYTTAHVDYTGSDPGWAGAWHQVDVTAIVQEIVNRGGWVPGNAIAFALTGVDNRNYYLPLADSAQGAGLGPELEYEVGPLLFARRRPASLIFCRAIRWPPRSPPSLVADSVSRALNTTIQASSGSIVHGRRDGY